MEKKKSVPVWVSVVLTVICLVILGCNIAMLVQGTPVGLLQIASIISCVSALIYCFGGYKKKSAVFSQVYLIGLLILSVAGVYSAITGAGYPGSLIINLILCVIAVILILVADLGRKKTFLLCIGAFLCGVASCISLATSGSLTLVAAANTILQTVLLNIMMIAKYKDKEARGRK